MMSKNKYDIEKYTDEQLSRILSEAATDNLVEGGCFRLSEHGSYSEHICAEQAALAGVGYPPRIGGSQWRMNKFDLWAQKQKNITPEKILRWARANDLVMSANESGE